jgi:3-phenylpropionate/cinnamic acid dioxygenase small subunit
LSVVKSDILNEIDALQIEYLRALDRRDWNGWLGCFDSEGSYICISKENVEQSLPLALMMDDCYARLQDRVTFITEVWAGTFEDYSTKHFVQRLECTETGPRQYAVASNFMLLYTARSGKSELLAAGEYKDDVILGPDGPRFRNKQAVLDTVTVPRYLVYPV